jgi:hypothetical protein
MIARRSKFLKADGPTARLTGDCGVDGCNRPVWRQDLCASHFKRKQRHQPVAGPIGDHIRPGGLEPGEVLEPEELFFEAARAYVEADSEDDEAFEKTKLTALRAAVRFAESKGYVKVKDALDLAEELGWSPPARRTTRARRTQHHHRRPQHTQLELPFREFFHEPDWADERRA